MLPLFARVVLSYRGGGPMEKTATLREAMALAATEPAGPRLRRRRGTLRSLLFRRFRLRGGDPSDRARDAPPASTGSKCRLEDLFLLHPPLDGPASERRAEARRHSSLEAEAVGGGGGGGLAVRRSGSRRLRPVVGSFRCRMLRRAWRPVLLTIPE